jgi:cytochrome o ubiquinol oxidase operon protein cyoD
MEHELTSIDHAYGAGRSTFASYVAGFFFSIVLTLIPYEIARESLLDGKELLYVVTGFGVLQLFVQLYFFLHLSGRSKARWNLVAILFTIFTVLFLVIGTIWIMENLSANMDPMRLMNMSDLTHGD